MSDELELLKKDWQKKEVNLPKLSYGEIHTMLWKKSSSIVKWIMIISIIEFLLPHLLYFLPQARNQMAIYDSVGLRFWIIGLTIIQYAVVAYFIFEFYKRYKEISVLDSAKNLMDKIIKTRKTVKSYVIFSLSLIFITMASFAFGIHLTSDLTPLTEAFEYEEFKKMEPEKLKKLLIGVYLAMAIIMPLIIGAIYFLLYGLLLRKLKKNHKELKRLEI
ncbi:hypothetical protein JQC67_17155 [Aurantibacter crassamenti]|uniref:hypothetical protein n=1 Tax=Aurantibacter crassamenti TaxID=1837375 RepID=UPI0019397AFA|nr:hypothetical protein [Aurantibacter crassamenti]MBM1107886.1 hypothetical protein [Aurantibacter crassamenti]